MSSKREFRVIKLCQKLCQDIVELQGTADKKYRYTICQDIRKKSERVVHIVRRANEIDAGREERIKLQKEADNLLEEIKDLIGIVCKLLNAGTKKEAQIELSIENLQIPLRNWCEKDQKIAVSALEKEMRRRGWLLYQAKKTYEIVKNYHEEIQNERTAIAYDESLARYRIAYSNYQSSIKEYDRTVKRLRETQERFHKDDSVLSEVLAEIKSRTGTEVPQIPVGNTQNQNVTEMKKEISKANNRILENNKDNFSKSTIERLKK